MKLKCSSLGGYPLPSIRWIKTPAQSSLNEQKEITGLEAGNGGHSGVSSELYIRLTASDNEAKYTCSLMNEAITSPLTASVILFPVYFMSSSLKMTPSETVQVKSQDSSSLANSIQVQASFPSDSSGSTSSFSSSSETALVCETDECFPPCNLTWYQSGYKLDPSLHPIVSSVVPGLYGGKKTMSKLVLLRKWSSSEDGSTVTCASSNTVLPNKRFSKNITVQVLCKSFDSMNLLNIIDDRKQSWKFSPKNKTKKKSRQESNIFQG